MTQNGSRMRTVKKEPYADVNRDGIYNMDDIVMFRDMTERINSIED